MNKPNTEKQLAEVRKINADIKNANIAAGAKYGEDSRYYIPPRQRSEFGEGAAHLRDSTDVPTTSFVYRGFNVLSGNEANHYKWTITPGDDFSLPKSLEGVWTDPVSAENAINQYWKQEELHGRKGI